MKLDQISELVWQMYEGGRPEATNQTLEQDDIKMMCLMEAAYQLKIRFYESRKMDEGEKTDFIAGMLGVKQYDLTDANYQGKRSVTERGDVMRLPRNMDVTNIFMVADNDCGDVNGRISQVQPGEESFYIGDNNLSSYKFFVQKGINIDTYNIPPCIKKIEVERIFSNSTWDIPLDVAWEVATTVLGVTLKVRGFIPDVDNSQDGNRNQLRYQLEKADAQKV